MRLLITLALLFGIFSLSAQQEHQYSRAKIYLDGHTVGDLERLGIDVDHGYVPGSDVFISDVDNFELQRIAEAGFRYELLIPDVTKYYQERSAEPVDQINSRSMSCFSPTYVVPSNFKLGSMRGFFTYEEMLANLDSMAAKYPDLITSREPIADSLLSIEGRPIYWLRISDNAQAEEDEPRILYNSLIHAREPQSLSQQIFYMWYLLENYASDPEIRYLVDHTEMYFVPCINPDGYIYNQTVSPNGGGGWRKNMRDNNGNGTFEPNVDGVDLNRNFGFNWGINNSGSSGNFGSETYRGTAPFSEPETRALRYICKKYEFEIGMNYHAYGHLLIHPFSYNDELADPALEAFAEVMSHESHFHAGTSIQTVNYRVNGDAGDWMFGDTITKPSIYAYIPETGSYRDGFWPAESNILPLCQSTLYQNLHAAHLLLNYGEVDIEPQSTINTIDEHLRFNITRYGLEEGALSVALRGLSPNVLTTEATKTYTLNHLQSQADSFAFSLAPDITDGDSVQFLLEIDNGLYTWTKTISLAYRWGEQIFFDPIDDFSNWEQGSGTSWLLQSDNYYSAPSCISMRNPTSINPLTLQEPIFLDDAEAAELQFWTRWNIRRDWGEANIQVAVDGSDDFTPLCGQHTVQRYDENNTLRPPVYDGQQSNWVKERIDLSDYLGQSIRLRIMGAGLRFEPGHQYFYIDDIEVRLLKEGEVSVSSLSEEGFQLSAPQPNPANTYTELQLANLEPSRLQVFDMLGRLQWEEALPVGESRLRLPTAAWPAGLYIYKLQGPGGVSSASQRLVVVH